ncbi:MAG: exodeoxyribonuclease V subunit gamma [Candidatus Electrothrix sp. YB6]
MYLHQSNRLENLFDGLCAVLDEPLTEPLAPEVIVVQNPGMARWLSQQIALRTGISANFSFPLPATFVWRVFEQTLGTLPDLSRFNRNVLLWRVRRELETLSDDPSMQEIRAYLREDRDGSRRFQLAGRITDLFDQYQVYRPAMLLHWEQGGERHWQARLWRSLTAADRNHRAALLYRFLEIAAKGGLRTDTLPERITVFGINSLPPAYLEVIDQLGRLIAVHVFHLSPCRQAWDDILPERLAAIRRQRWRKKGVEDVSNYFITGNPLLASLGAVGQGFFCLLMERNPVEVELYEAPESSDSSCLLSLIQQDILELHDPGADRRDRGQQHRMLIPGDRSVRFHCCHSPMREIQVLHDRLLDFFADDPTLKPADILVMAPDIALYAPAVAGVFGSAPAGRRIPWSIADQSGREEQPIIDGFLSILELIGSRFTAPEVMALLENQAILRRFGLVEENMSFIRARLTEAGVRWGLDQEQRKEQGMEGPAEHTWEFGLDRLLLGWVMGPLNEPWQGIMPCSGMLNDTGSWLGGLTHCIRSLQELHWQMKMPRPPAAWGELLLRLTTDFFADDGRGGEQEGLLLLRRTITDFTEYCRTAEFDREISLPVVRHWFVSRLSEPAGGQAFLAGRVTFCNMVPMRSVPFKVIWLLGMNDGDYPRTQRPPAFDLMARQPRLGDRNRRDDDRYLFLEALLSARQHLAISWVGRNQQDNASLPPSVVVAELRDYINRGWITWITGEAAEKEKDRSPADLLTVEYPLQPFSRHCFDGNPATASYAAEWMPGPAAAGSNEAEGTGAFVFAGQLLPPSASDLPQIDLSRFIRFWNHPVRFFLEQRIGLRTRFNEELLPESEAFALDHLQKYFLSVEIMNSRRADLPDRQPLPVLYRMQAEGRLPGGNFGRILCRKMEQEVAELIEGLEPIIRKPAEPMDIRLQVDGVQLIGQLSSLYSSGRVTFRPATLKAKDILQLWINHLVLLLRLPAAVAPISIHAARKQTVCFQEVDDPQAELAELIALFRQGEAEPLHFYPNTSYAWAKAKSEGAKWNAARRVWSSGYSGFSGGEGEDPAYEIALRAHEPLDQRFARLAGLFSPILRYMEEPTAG